MSYLHKNLVAGRWSRLSFAEQMANIGSEVGRYLQWRSRQNPDYARQAFERSLELIDLTIAGLKAFPRLKELCRIRAALVGHFDGTNEFKFTDESLNNYFLNFVFAARKNR